MELLSVVIHKQYQQDLMKELNEVQEFAYRKAFNDKNENIIRCMIEKAFASYNSKSWFDELELTLEFDRPNGRTHMNINQVPLVYNFPPYLKIQ